MVFKSSLTAQSGYLQLCVVSSLHVCSGSSCWKSWGHSRQTVFWSPASEPSALLPACPYCPTLKTDTDLTVPVCFLSHVRKRHVPLRTSFEESHQTLVEPGVIGVQWVSSLHRLQHQKILLYKHTLGVLNPETLWITMFKFISMLTFPEVDLKGQQMRVYFILY